MRVDIGPEWQQVTMSCIFLFILEFILLESVDRALSVDEDSEDWCDKVRFDNKAIDLDSLFGVGGIFVVGDNILVEI